MGRGTPRSRPAAAPAPGAALDAALQRLATIAGRKRFPRGTETLAEMDRLVEMLSDDRIIALLERASSGGLDAADLAEVEAAVRDLERWLGSFHRASWQVISLTQDIADLVHQVGKAHRKLERSAHARRQRELRETYAAETGFLVPVTALASDAFDSVPQDFPTDQVPLCSASGTPLAIISYLRTAEEDLRTFSGLRARLARARIRAGYSSQRRPNSVPFESIFVPQRVLARRVAAWQAARKPATRRARASGRRAPTA